MRKITFDSYLEDIKMKYELEKTKGYSNYLAEPSPGSIYDLCFLLKNSEITAVDKKILNDFLESDKFDIDKFRPICNFFTGKTKKPKKSVVDVMAVLIDFKPRPLGQYLVEKGGVENKEEGVKKESGGKLVDVPPGKDPENPKRNKFNLIDWMCNTKTRLIGSIAVLMLTVFGITKYAVDDMECMQWQEDHFEIVYCETKPDESTNGNPKIPIDEELLDFRKIKITDTTTFFKNGKPIVWYCKTGDEFECFNEPGVHPLNNKTLKPISNRMIGKYAYKQ